MVFLSFDRASSSGPCSAPALLCTISGGAITTFGIRKKPGLLVTVPYHSRDLKRATLRSILRQAGITPEELPDLL
jgi:hypothetical protein